MEQKKKIILVTGGFPFGDTERGFLSEEFRQLSRAFDVHIISVGSREALIHPLPEGVTAERFFYPPLDKIAVAASLAAPELRRELTAGLKGQPLSNALARGKQILAFRANAKTMAARMEQLMQQKKADLIYTYWCTEATMAALMLKKRHPGLKVVTRFHGHDLYQERKPTGLQPFRHLIGAGADRLIFAYRGGKEYFLSRWGEVFREKAVVRYLGCPETGRTARGESDVLRLVSCSNLIELKRVDRIIDAIALLPREIPVQWDHFGDGILRQQLEQRAGEKLGQHVCWKFHGRIPNHEIADAYRRLDPDLFLTASSTEGGVPVSIQEAFSMGIPVAATCVGGIADAVEDGYNGFLLSEAGTAEELKGAVLRYVECDPSRRQALSDGAYRTWAERFDARKNGEILISELKDLLWEEKSEI